MVSPLKLITRATSGRCRWVGLTVCGWHCLSTCHSQLTDRTWYSRLAVTPRSLSLSVCLSVCLLVFLLLLSVLNSGSALFDQISIVVPSFCLSRSLCFNGHFFQVDLGWPVFIGAKDDGGGGDNWSYKTCKAVKSSSPTNQRPAFYRPDVLPVTQPTVSKYWRQKLFIKM